MALTKADIAEHLVDTVYLDRRDAKELVEIFFENIRASLVEGKAVKLSGFGNFNLRDKTARPGRNPKTGVEVAITPRRVVTFRAGHKLRARIENNLLQQTASGRQ